MTAALIKAVAALAFMMLNALMLVYAERKILGHMQARMGPMVTGPHGILQTIADAIKLMTKEDVIPDKADKWLFVLAPAIVFVPSYVLYVTIPFSENVVARDLELGLFFVFAIAALFPIGIVISGWASNNKYSLLGGLRAAAQQISYEVPLLLSVLGVVMLAGSMSLTDIVEAQKPIWYIVLQPHAFLIFLITAVAELNRTPFDMPEAESELVAGFATEYSGMRWGLFMLAEYSNMLILSALAALLFLGGWNAFGLPIPPWLVMLVKTYFMVFVIIWLRGTLPRVRVDQLMDLGWKILLPLTLLNLMVTGFAVWVLR